MHHNDAMKSLSWYFNFKFSVLHVTTIKTYIYLYSWTWTGGGLYCMYTFLFSLTINFLYIYTCINSHVWHVSFERPVTCRVKINGKLSNAQNRCQFSYTYIQTVVYMQYFLKFVHLSLCFFWSKSSV